jgi:hypothetical protein
MVPLIREQYNNSFSEKIYSNFLNELRSTHPNQLDFRVAETPVFVDKDFTNKILNACESIIDVLETEDYKLNSERAIPEQFRVKNETPFSHFIAFDFGVCINNNNELEPQLIELQGFPTLFAYQVFQNQMVHKYFTIPNNYSCYLNNYNEETYLQLLKEIIVGNHNPENVILLEIFPEKQKTRIDFSCTQEYLKINTVCLTQLIIEGENLFYLNNGKKTAIHRIYNRIIFDELQQQPAVIQEKSKFLFNEINVEWVPHPNWFYKISKFSLPFIQHPYVPKTYFLHELKQLPNNLENYVLKPLFSFAGQGVIIDVTEKDIIAIQDPENWILQKKVQYANVIKTPTEFAKAEIRIFYFWKEGEKRPVATNNLARLSKGKMIGVRYNKDKDWVGGSLALFEK